MDRAQGELKLDLKEHEKVEIWANMDIEYINQPLFVLDFEFMINDEMLLKGGVDPLNVEEYKRKTERTDGKVKVLSYMGKLEGEFVARRNGRHTIKTTFIRNKDEGLKVKRAEVVFFK